MLRMRNRCIRVESTLSPCARRRPLEPRFPRSRAPRYIDTEGRVPELRASATVPPANGLTACRTPLHMAYAGSGTRLQHFHHTPGLYVYRGLPPVASRSIGWPRTEVRHPKCVDILLGHYRSPSRSSVHTHGGREYCRLYRVELDGFCDIFVRLNPVYRN